MFARRYLEKFGDPVHKREKKPRTPKFDYEIFNGGMLHSYVFLAKGFKTFYTSCPRYINPLYLIKMAEQYSINGENTNKILIQKDPPIEIDLGRVSYYGLFGNADLSRELMIIKQKVVPGYIGSGLHPTTQNEADLIFIHIMHFEPYIVRDAFIKYIKESNYHPDEKLSMITYAQM